MIYKNLISLSVLPLLFACAGPKEDAPIDRQALLERNSPVVSSFDSLSTLTVGNGGFAFSVDATGLQTFPEIYAAGVPLGTMSDWGWHSFANTEGYTFAETLIPADFGRGRKELYASQTSRAEEEKIRATGTQREIAAFERRKGAIAYMRQNPHRLHLGTVGLYLPDNGEAVLARFDSIRQRLDLMSGIISSNYKLDGEHVEVRTSCDPQSDRVAFSIRSGSPKPILIRMPYPTGNHSDDACLWIDDARLHSTRIAEHKGSCLTIDHVFPAVEVTDEFDRRERADFSYSLRFESSDNRITVEQISPNAIVIAPSTGDFDFVCEWLPKGKNPYTGDAAGSARGRGKGPRRDAAGVEQASRRHWQDYWSRGAVVDFSLCKATEARELERRVVLSQYLLAVNCAGDTPPQETGLTYNSWFGKFHMEMIWWHQAQFALYGHPELLQRSLQWYAGVEPVAREIARRQGFQGVRWMKMTDPSGLEAPSSTGSFLIWQQPHYIYLAELVRRAYAGQEGAAMADSLYYDLVRKTAEFMFDFATYDTLPNRYILKGAIPAQETLRAATTINPPFELSQWYFALGVANEWRERHEGRRNMEWDELRDKLSPLHYITDSLYSPTYGDLYTASEDAEDTYRDIRLTSDHMAVLGAYGIFPKSPLVREDIMRNTLRWVWDNWNWGKTWGWDFPMTAMCAARLGERQMAVDVLLGNKRTNTYLPSGHNYQDSRLRLYLPGNGGLLTAVAMMCAGWDGNTKGRNPGFPNDGNWEVRWEGLLPLP